MIEYSADSEEYINQEEEYFKKWEIKYGAARDRAYQLIEEVLSTKSMSSIEQLLDFFEDKELVKELSNVNDFAFLVVLMEIYDLECQENVKHTVFHWADTFQDMIDVIRQVKFLLWEMEFLADDESGLLLKNYLVDMNISMAAFQYLVYISSYDKEKMVDKLTRLF